MFIWLTDFDSGSIRGVALDQVAVVGMGGGEWADRTKVVTKAQDYLWCRETPEQVRAIMDAVKRDDRHNSLAALPPAE